MAMYGRHGEAPLPIVAAQRPAHCFYAAIEAARIALKYRTPVILLSDGYLANGAEPWRLPDVDVAARHRGRRSRRSRTTSTPTATELLAVPARPETLARPWAIPGTPGLMHRIGGIEKEDGTGNISYDPENHERMVRLRAAKVAGIADDIPDVEVDGDADGAELLVRRVGLDVGRDRRRRCAGCAPRRHKVGPRPPRAPQPVPAEPRRGRCARYPKVLVPEMNLGQLSRLVRAEFLVDAQSGHTRCRACRSPPASSRHAILEDLSR